MDLYVLNPELDIVGIIDSFQSLTWTSRYSGVGNFTLSISLTEETLYLAKEGNIIVKEDEACYITKASYNVNQGGVEVIVVYGFSLLNYLSKRIIWDTLNYSGTAEGLIRKMIEDNAISCAEKRVIPHLQLGAVCGAAATLSMQISYENLLEAAIGICETHMLGMRFDMDVSGKKIIFCLYQGTDRSLSQNHISPCVFSRNFENVSRQVYTYDTADYKNVGVVAGEGEGVLRKIVLIEGDEIGLDRAEVYIEARDISSVKQESGQTIVISDQEYMELLRNRGESRLAQFVTAESVDCDVNNTVAVYKKDYFLGDIVTVLDSKWGIAINVRVTEVTETYENGIVAIQPVFGKRQLNLVEKIKREVK